MIVQKNVFKRMTNTLFVGKVYLHFDELASTNDYARELIAKSKPPEGTVVSAATQSAGRGQFGSQWWSEPRANLTLSVVFYPEFLAVSNQFRLSETVALAVRDTVVLTVGGGRETVDGGRETVDGGRETVDGGRETVDGGRWTADGRRERVDGRRANNKNELDNKKAPSICRPSSTVHIKWPNDIYINGRKTAGILIQNSLLGNHIQASVVGIGLNLNQRSFPENIPNATSLSLETGGTFDLDAVAGVLFMCLERRYMQLKTGRAAPLIDEYHRHLLGVGEVRQFLDRQGNQLTGIIRGVGDDGRLIVETGNETFLYAVKEIQML